MTKSVFIGRSGRHDKKYMVLINRKLIHFGKTSEFNFTQTHDVNAKRIYLAKHPGLNDISKKDLLYKPSFWERWLLWNKPSKRESIRYLERKLNIEIRPFRSSTLKRCRAIKGGSVSNNKSLSLQRVGAAVGLGAAVAGAGYLLHERRRPKHVDLRTPTDNLPSDKNNKVRDVVLRQSWTQMSEGDYKKHAEAHTQLAARLYHEAEERSYNTRPNAGVEESKRETETEARPQPAAPVWQTINKKWYQSPKEYFKSLGVLIVEQAPNTNRTANVHGTVIAIGDIHGDIDALLMALYVAKVIDIEGNWVGGNTTVVQLGDQIDRKRDGRDFTDTNRCFELEVLQYTEHLHRQAQLPTNENEKGNFFSLLGNHEIMSTSLESRLSPAAFYDRYASAADLACFSRAFNFTPGIGLIASRIFASRPVVIQIGKFVFSHADVGTFAVTDDLFDFKFTKEDGGNSTLTLAQLNFFMFSYLHRVPKENKKQSRKLRGNESSISREIQNVLGIVSKNGPLWNQDICREEPAYTKLTDGVTLKFVAGHTVQKPSYKIQEKIKDQVWCVDTAMSEAFKLGGVSSYEYHRERAQSLKIKNIKTPHLSVVSIISPPPEGQIALKVCFSHFIPNVWSEFIGEPVFIDDKTAHLFGRNHSRVFQNFAQLEDVAPKHFQLRVEFPSVFVKSSSRDSDYKTLITTDFKDFTDLTPGDETLINVNEFIVIPESEEINGIALKIAGKLMWVIKN